MEPSKKRAREEKVYIAVHKPVGCVSSAKRQHDGKTIYELLATFNFDFEKVGLCGRLDADTSGIMLFTNDSAMQRALLTPDDAEADTKKECEDKEDREGKKENREEGKKASWKEYHLTVLASPHRKWGTEWDENMEKALVEELSVPLEFSFKGKRHLTKAAELKVLNRFRSEEHAHGSRGPLGQDLGWCATLSVILREGKHHQIRRICSRSRLQVLSLKRVSFAGGLISIEDPTLAQPGSARYLKEEEVDQLKSHLLESH